MKRSSAEVTKLLDAAKTDNLRDVVVLVKNQGVSVDSVSQLTCKHKLISQTPAKAEADVKAGRGSNKVFGGKNVLADARRPASPPLSPVKNERLYHAHLDDTRYENTAPQEEVEVIEPTGQEKGNVAEWTAPHEGEPESESDPVDDTAAAVCIADGEEENKAAVKVAGKEAQAKHQLTNLTKEYSPTVMSELMQVKTKIAKTEDKIAETEAKAKIAEDAGDFARRDRLEALQISLQDNLAALNNNENLLMTAGSASGPNGELLLTDRFRWDNRTMASPQMHRYFPRTGFDKWVLQRESVVELVTQAREQQLGISPGESTSVFISGCKATGKTCLLELVAQRLDSEGWEVYWFRSAADIPRGVGDAFLARATAAPQTKIAVIVDEVASNPDSGMFTALLKNAPPNIFVIGAAVPSYLPGVTFRFVLRHSDVVLKDDDTDVSALVAHWKATLAPAVPPQTVDFVCSLLLSYCGGHTYAVLAFMELIFTTDAQKAVLMQGEAAFLKHFYSEAFASSVVYRDICARCFDYLPNPLSYETLVRVLNGSGDSVDVGTLLRLGWWDPEKSDVPSTLLLNECLLAGNTEIDTDKKEKKLFVDGNKPAQANLELLVVEGLARMDEHDFKCVGDNALSFNWAHRACFLFDNVHMRFQYPGTGGRNWMDFYVSGNINGAVEVQHNGGAQDMNDHMARLVSGKYPFTTFVLLNFAMDPQAEVVLPDDPTHHNRVFTYQHTTNKLFRGLTEIKSPAVNRFGGAPGRTGPAGDQRIRRKPNRVKLGSAAGLARQIHTLCRIW